MKRKKDRLCGYCGEQANSRDHIPPQCMFPDSVTEDLISVPACGTCHGNTSLDDEYFKRVVANIGGPIWNAAQAEVRAKDARGLMRTESWRSERAFCESIEPAWIVANSGLVTGIGKSIRADPARISRVLTRIVRGLYFHGFGERLPSSGVLRVSSVVGMMRAGFATATEVENYASAVADAPGGCVGIREQVFAYRVIEIESRGRSMLQWLLGFYGRSDYFIHTDLPEVTQA